MVLPLEDAAAGGSDVCVLFYQAVTASTVTVKEVNVVPAEAPPLYIVVNPLFTRPIRINWQFCRQRHQDCAPAPARSTRRRGK